MKPRYVLEAAALYLAYGFFKILPLDAASATGGFIGRTFGPHMAASRKARRNLEMALPERSDAEYRAIIKEMWDNLGRVIAEYPHLKKIGKERVEIHNGHIFETLRDDHMPGIVFTAHIGNWEIGAMGAFYQYGLQLNGVYRRPNNPLADRLLGIARNPDGAFSPVSKSSAGTRQLVRALKEGRHIGMLIDQKYNEGIPALFFGRPAMTSTAFIELCLKFNCPLVPARIERLEGAHFRLTPFPPLELYNAGGDVLTVEKVVETAHNYLEEWISDKPGQWLWLHRRWSDKAKERFEEQKKKAA